MRTRTAGLLLGALLLTGCGATPEVELQDAVAEATDAANAGDSAALISAADDLVRVIAEQESAGELSPERARVMRAAAVALQDRAGLLDVAATPTPAPTTEQPTPTPEPTTEEPTPEPTPEPTTEEPEPTPEPTTEEPEPTPEPTTELPLPLPTGQPDEDEPDEDGPTQSAPQPGSTSPAAVAASSSPAPSVTAAA